MLAAEKMMVQGFHYPFPAHAYIEKTATGYRETMVPWNRGDLIAANLRTTCKRPPTGGLFLCQRSTERDRPG